MAARAFSSLRKMRSAIGTLAAALSTGSALADEPRTSLPRALARTSDHYRAAGLEQVAVLGQPFGNSTASYPPEWSENCTTPILLPVRVLRSCLRGRCRPAGPARPLHRGEIRPVLDPHLVQPRLYSSSGWPGGRSRPPGTRDAAARPAARLRRAAQRLPAPPAAEMSVCPDARWSCAAAPSRASRSRPAIIAPGRGRSSRARRPRQALQRALVDGARVDALGEIEEVAERPVAGAPRRWLAPPAADALDGRQRIADADSPSPSVDLEVAPERLTRAARPRCRAAAPRGGIPTSLSVLSMSSVMDAAMNSTG